MNICPAAVLNSVSVMVPPLLGPLLCGGDIKSLNHHRHSHTWRIVVTSEGDITTVAFISALQRISQIALTMTITHHLVLAMEPFSLESSSSPISCCMDPVWQQSTMHTLTFSQPVCCTSIDSNTCLAIFK